MFSPKLPAPWSLVHRSALDLDWYGGVLQSWKGVSVYAASHHLDAVCAGNWAVAGGPGPLVAEWKWLLPLPYRPGKLHLPWIMQPLFTQQLGLIYDASLTKQQRVELLSEVLKWLSRQPFPTVYSFNHLNFLDLQAASLLAGLEVAPNYVLPLAPPFDETAEGFERNLIRKLRRRFPHHYTYDQEWQSVVQLFEQHINPGRNILNQRHLERLRRMIVAWQSAGSVAKPSLISARAADPDGNLLAGLLYLVQYGADGNPLRYVTFMGGATALGKKQDSQMKLMAENISHWSQQNAVYDFEGSRIPGIAKVFSTYGSVVEPYAVFRKGWL